MATPRLKSDAKWFWQLRWVGGPFDPSDFDIRAVNRELAALKV